MFATHCNNAVRQTRVTMTKTLTEEQFRQYEGIINEVERLRNLTRKEKERIIRNVFERTYIDLTCDWAFKHVFGNHPDILMMLLNDILPETIVRVEYDTNEIDRESARDKNIIMDVFCHTSDGRRFVVEMQKESRDGFHQRMLYYGAARLREQLKPGDDYAALEPVYVICFMDHVLHHEGSVPQGKIIFAYSLREEQTGEPYWGGLYIFLCELPRLSSPSVEGLTPQEQWFVILRNSSTFAEMPHGLDPRFSKVFEIASTRGLKKKEELQYLRAMITQEEKDSIAKANYELGMLFGRDEGLAKGREEGRDEGRIETARQFLDAGIPAPYVAKITGIPEEKL